MQLFEELKDLDINDIGSWSRQVKLFMMGLLCLVLLGLAYKFVIIPQQEELEEVKRKLPGLKDQFMEKKALAINLDAYKAQMVEAKEMFEVLKTQLPNASEIPGLLTDVTQAGLSRGLQFEQIKPGNTIAKDFYAEKLVNVTVNGQYNQIASFISDIAGLPRIINVDNFELSRTGEGDGSLLKLKAVTKTYHYLDEAGEVQ